MSAPLSRAAVRAADTRPTGKAAETVACGLLSDGLRNSRAEIDLRAACLPREALGRVFAQVMNGTPELFTWIAACPTPMMRQGTC